MNLAAFIERHQLPAAFEDSVDRCFLPLARWLENQMVDRASATRASTTMVLGINGAQGTGKSTVADYLSAVLSAEYGRRVAVLSLDDLYLTKAERESLADDVHPLFATRGVPGTHDVDLGVHVIEQLKSSSAGDTVALPRFDKSTDDRLPPDQWPVMAAPIDLVILEGWCVGSLPGHKDELAEPINELESAHDSAGSWRGAVNEALRTDYVRLFSLIDMLLFMQAPGFDAITHWRVEQEHKLRQAAGPGAPGVMSDSAVIEFIQYFERITRRNLDTLPAVADALIVLDIGHAATALHFSADNTTDT